MRYLIKATALVLLLALAIGAAADDKVLPSTAKAEVMKALRAKQGEIKTREQYLEVVKSATLEILDTVQSEGLVDDEKLAFGELLSWAQKKDEAKAVFEELAQGEGFTAREACLQLMSAVMEEDDLEKLEGMITDYRRRFSPTPDHPAHLYGPVSYLAYKYGEKGEHGKAADAIIAELSTLPLDAPYGSFSLLRGYESFLESGRKDELFDLLDDYIGKIEKLVDEAPDKEDRGVKSFERILRTLESAKVQASLPGAPAPVINFTRFFNCDPFSMEDLKGKIVMIDFFANWCGPCKSAFPGMRAIYEEFKDKGFVIVSVTSLQGYYVDGDIREGLPNRDLAPEREIELTEQFVKDHGMTWPVVLSDRSCFDPEYGVTGIPTFAIVDKNGNVAKVQVGSGSEEELRAYVAKMLAEQ